MKNILDENPIYTESLTVLEGIKSQLQSELSSTSTDVSSDGYWVDTLEGYRRQYHAEMKIAKILENQHPSNPVAVMFREYAQDSKDQSLFLETLKKKYAPKNKEPKTSKTKYSQNLIEELSAAIEHCIQQKSKDGSLQKILLLRSMTGETFQEKITDMILHSVSLLSYNREQIDAIYRDFVIHDLVENNGDKDAKCQQLLSSLIRHMLGNNSG